MLKIIPLLMLFVAPSFAQEAPPITVSGINVKEILNVTRVGVWLPVEGGRSFKTVYTPLVWFHGADGTEYAAFDVGAAAPGDITQGYAFVALGFRVDNILTKVLNVSKWMRTHVSAATLPTLDIGAGPILYQSKVRFGASVATKF